jgi:hypothetical protein
MDPTPVPNHTLAGPRKTIPTIVVEDAGESSSDGTEEELSIDEEEEEEEVALCAKCHKRDGIVACEVRPDGGFDFIDPLGPYRYDGEIPDSLCQICYIGQKLARCGVCGLYFEGLGREPIARLPFRCDGCGKGVCSMACIGIGTMTSANCVCLECFDEVCYHCGEQLTEEDVPDLPLQFDNEAKSPFCDKCKDLLFVADLDEDEEEEDEEEDNREDGEEWDLSDPVAPVDVPSNVYTCSSGEPIAPN